MDRDISIELKKIIMRLRYRINLINKMFAKLPLLLFAITFILFLIILVPNVAHRSPMLSSVFNPDVWPRELELSGYIYLNTINDDNLFAVPGAKIEIGGYNAVTDSEGMFRKGFVSESFNNIPVVIQWSNKTWIKRVSFESNEFKKSEVFVLNEGRL